MILNSTHMMICSPFICLKGAICKESLNNGALGLEDGSDVTFSLPSLILCISNEAFLVVLHMNLSACSSLTVTISGFSIKISS